MERGIDNINYVESGKFIYRFQYQNYMGKKINKYYITEIDGNGFEISEDEINKENFDKLKQTAKPSYNFFRPGSEEEREFLK